MSFNYSKFHFFDKSGTELMLKKSSTITIVIENPDYPSFNSTYSLVLSDPNNLTDSVLIKTKSGSRFKHQNPNAVVSLSNGEAHSVGIPSQYYNWIEYSSSKGYVRYDSSTPSGPLEGYPELNYNSLNDSQKADFLSLLGINSSTVSYPSMTFEGNLVFDKISTELVETQSLYVLVETDTEYNNNFGIHGMVDASTYAKTNSDASNYINKYELFFFIDCRDQKDFRFFTIDGDDVVWSDRHYMEMKYGRINGNDNGFRVDIGFRGELEGVYEQKLYVCLFEKSTQNVTIIGTFNMTAETEGEDERYRAFIANFGLPSLDDIEPAFRETNMDEDLPDYISRNKHAKKLFLSYSEIFPYAGTYKALVNAVKFLGYDDIFFKEWYKNIGNPTPNDDGYVAFDVVFGSNSHINTINSKPIEERIHLRKMNWLSIVYKLNEEVGGVEDKWGFPGTKENINYYNTDNLVKLLSLREWLDKYIVGVNCRITDVSGEGIVFERYNTLKYGQYQRVFDYTNEKPLSLTINDTTETIVDGSANLSININTSNQYDMIEEFRGKRFIDLCEGYFNASSVFSDDINESLEDNKDFVYFGKTFDLHNNMDSFELRAKGSINSFRFNNGEFIHSEHPQLIVDNDSIIFNPYDLTKKPKNSAFVNLPIIKLSQARIKRYKKNMETYGELSYDASVFIDEDYKINVQGINFETNQTFKYKFDEDITLIPPTTEDIVGGINMKPRFSPKNVRSFSSPFSIYGETPNLTVPFDNRTYGLRFSADTLSGEPVFMIAGYESPQVNLKYSSHFPLTNQIENDEPYEYCIEILNGSLIFNNPEHDRKISVNFEFDGYKKSINTDTFQYETQFTLYEYKTGDSEIIDRFTNGKNYSYFTSGYKVYPELYVLFDTTRFINVTNAGSYIVDVIAYDEYNNMFHSVANGTINVVTPDIDASTFSIDSSSRTDYNLEGIRATSDEANTISNIGEDENNRCIYELIPKLSIVSRNGLDFEISGLDTETASNIDNGTVLFRNNSSFMYSQITNTTERFVFIGTYVTSGKTVLSFIRRSYRQSNIGPVGINEYNDIARAAHVQKIPSPNEGRSVDEMLNLFYGVSTDINSDGSYADVMVTLYDESCEYPLFTYPGVCLPTRNYGYDSNYKLDEYRVIFDGNVVSASDVQEFIDAAKSPSSTIYIVPAWSLICQVDSSDSSIMHIPGYTFIKYPFSKNLVVDDVYKILFINGNDGTPAPEPDPSPYEYEVKRMYIDADDASTYDDASIYSAYYYNPSKKNNVDGSYVSPSVYRLGEGVIDADKEIYTKTHKNIFVNSASNTPKGVMWRSSETNIVYGTLEPSHQTMKYSSNDYSYAWYLVKDYDSDRYDVYVTVEHNLDYSWVKLDKVYPDICDAYGQSSFHIVNHNDGTVKLDASVNKRYGTDASLYAILHVSHAARDYSEFITNISEEDSNYGSGLMSLKNTPINRDISYYFDTTYTASFRNFHVRNGIDLWNEINSSKLTSMYSYNCPISTRGNEVIILPILSEEYTMYSRPIDIITSEEYTTKWQVFKQHGNSKHTLLFECFNKVLSLVLEEKGSYDVDLTIYDRHGNKFHKFLMGAVTIE